MTHDSAFSLRARYVLPVAAPPIENGILRVQRGAIAAVEPAGRAAYDEDLGDVVLLPGCVNAHTHLEFSALDSPLGHPGISFPDWIRRVVAWRRSLAGETSLPQVILGGIDESRRHGVTAIGDICTDRSVAGLLAKCETPAVAFFELLGLSDELTEKLVETGVSYIEQHGPLSNAAGLSPHAPYTVNIDCLSRLANFSARSRVPLAMHLAESREELELLSQQSGPLVEMLEEWGAWHPRLFQRGMAAIDYLQALGRAHRALVIHGNYLTAREIAWLAGKRGQMSVVLCPRTHAFFGHPPHPTRALLDSQIVVALGTDSRASNPDLSLFAEMRCLSDRQTDVSPAEVVRMGTLNGAIALGHGHLRGSLSPGKQADFVVVEISDSASDPYAAILADPARVARVYVAGRRVV